MDSQVVCCFPGGDFFSGPVDSFLSRAESYFRSFMEYANRWKSLLDILTPNLCFVEDCKFDAAWKGDVMRLYSDKEFHDRVIFGGDFSGLHSPVKDFFEDSVRLSLSRRETREVIPVKPYKCLCAETTSDKAQEVLHLTHAIDIILNKCFALDSPILEKSRHETIQELLSHVNIETKVPLKKENLHFVDIGAGKGFLPVFLTNELQIKTLSIEASLNHSRQFIERIALLAKKKRVDVAGFGRLRMCIGYVTENTNLPAIVANSISYQKWAATVLAKEDDPLQKMRDSLLPEGDFHEDAVVIDSLKAEDITKPRVIQGELAHEILSLPSVDLSPLESFCVSIHACGDLSVVSHEIALKYPQCRGAVSVPCCFQHLTQQKCPLMRCNDKLFDFLFSGDADLRKDFLNHALSNYFVKFEKRHETMNGFIPREVISAYIPPRVSVKKTKRNEGESEVQYYQRIANQYGNNPSAEEIQAKIDSVNDSAWRLMSQQLFREFFGHAFESFVLLDRLAYYSTLVRDSPHKYLIGMFDVMSPFSPRAFSQFTIRVD